MYTVGNINNPMVWIAISGVVVLLFGGQKIPELMKSIAQGKRAFDDALQEQPPKSADVPSSPVAEAPPNGRH